MELNRFKPSNSILAEDSSVSAEERLDNLLDISR